MGAAARWLMGLGALVLCAGMAIWWSPSPDAAPVDVEANRLRGPTRSGTELELRSPAEIANETRQAIETSQSAWADYRAPAGRLRILGSVIDAAWPPGLRSSPPAGQLVTVTVDGVSHGAVTDPQ